MIAIEQRGGGVSGQGKEGCERTGEKLNVGLCYKRLIVYF